MWVEADSIAEKAGVRPGWYIAKINGKTVEELKMSSKKGKKWKKFLEDESPVTLEFKVSSLTNIFRNYC